MNGFELLQGLDLWPAAWALEMSLRVSPVLILVWFFTRLNKKVSAAQRHVWWCLALSMGLWVPLWQLIGPKMQWELLPAVAIQAPEQFVPSPGQGSTDAPQTEVGFPPPPHQIAESSSGSLEQVLVWTYLGVAGVFLLHLLLGLCQVVWITYKAKPLRAARSLELVAALRTQMGLRRKLHCLVSRSVSMPFTWGILKPSIILPYDFPTWPESTQRNVLIHEMAHVCRGDWLTCILARMSMIVHWFNPLSWKALNRLRLEAERACDDLVLGLGHSPTQYADQLLGFAGAANRQRITSAAMTTMATRSDFSERMLAILDHQERRQLLKFRQLCCLGLVGIVMTALSAGVELKGQSGQHASTSGETAVDRPTNRALNLALVNAVEAGLVGVIQTLIDSGADVNYKKWGDGTPLMIATSRGNHQLVRLLLDQGAEPNLAVLGDGSALIQAAMRGDLEMTRMLLDAGADVNLGVRGDGSPLQVAISRRQRAVVDLLLQEDVDVNLAVPGDGNPLIAAAVTGDLEIAEALLSRGADVDGFVYGDETPLIGAVAAQEIDMVELLMEYGADVNKAVPHNRWGGLRSPLGMALSKGNHAIVDLLRRHGAQETD